MSTRHTLSSRPSNRPAQATSVRISRAKWLLAMVAATSLASLGFAAEQIRPSQDAAKPAVLIELFTSQGCYSCPPADQLLRELGAQSNVIPLSFHVDYWNHLGWKDPFSSKTWSDRQRAYAQILGSDTIYTPQLVISGDRDEVGSDAKKIQFALSRAQNEATKGQTIGLEVVAARTAKMVTARSELSEGRLASGSLLLVALYERNLATEIPAGENRNKTLSYDYVVRALKETSPGEPVKFKLDPEWKAADLGIVAFVQDQRKGSVLGVARAAEPLVAGR